MPVKVKLHILEEKYPKNNLEFYVKISKLHVLSSCKYFGITLNDFLDYQACALEIAEAGDQALGIVSKFKIFNNIGFNTFTKLYHIGVVPMDEYTSGN